MNKVICNVCGTSYPENAVQCPICGYVHNLDNFSTDGFEETETTYTHVRGGRYSKANVKKRNLANQKNNTETTESTQTSTVTQTKNTRGGLIIVVIILLLAIIIAGGYIALRFFIPNQFIYEGTDHFTVPATSESVETATEALSQDTYAADSTLEVTASTTEVSVVLSDKQVTLQEKGETYQLVVTLEPADTNEILTLTSSDPSVASVDSNGVITANSEGTAIVIATCGQARAECSVVCTFADEPSETGTTEPEEPASGSFILNRREITFDMEGQSWVLYDGGDISVFDITWYSDDETVATIVNGKVVAVANGDTTVYGSYNDQVVSCIIHCNFNETGTETNSGVSEAGGNSERTYKLHNPYGLADDVTIHIGEQFPLMLVDESENEITDAQWTVGNTDYCSYEDEIVKGLAIGTTEITATYEGTTYTCVVRVIE